MVLAAKTVEKDGEKVKKQMRKCIEEVLAEKKVKEEEYVSLRGVLKEKHQEVRSEIEKIEGDVKGVSLVEKSKRRKKKKDLEERKRLLFDTSVCWKCVEDMLQNGEAQKPPGCEVGNPDTGSTRRFVSSLDSYRERVYSGNPEQITYKYQSVCLTLPNFRVRVKACIGTICRL